MPTKKPKKLITFSDEDIQELERLKVVMGLKTSSAVIRKLIRTARSKIT